MLLSCDRECRVGWAVAAPPRRRRPRGRGWAGLFTCPMPDQMRMSMPGGNRCSGWAVTAVDALARDVPLSARGRGCRAVPARVAARVPRKHARAKDACAGAIPVPIGAQLWSRRPCNHGHGGRATTV